MGLFSCRNITLVVFFAFAALFLHDYYPKFEILPKKAPSTVLPASQSTRYWVNSRGEPMFVREWVKHENPKALVFYFHGMSSHSGERPAANFFEKLDSENIDVIALDQIGHGQSVKHPDDLQMCEDWHSFIDDATGLIQDTMTNNPKYANVPFFLFGHSLGGAISLLTSINITNQNLRNPDSPLRKFSGAILMAPAIYQSVSSRFDIIKIKILEFALAYGGKAVSALRLGPYPNPHGFDTIDLFEDYLTDPHTYVGKIKVGFAYQALDMLGFAQKSLTEVTYPFLVLHGDNDKAVPLWSSQKLIDESKTAPADKKLVIFPNQKHNPIASDQVRSLSEFTAWVNERLALQQN